MRAKSNQYNPFNLSLITCDYDLLNVIDAMLPRCSQGGSRERRGHRGKPKKGKVAKTRNWVLAKKEQQRRQGRDVRDDNKFTGRKRKDKF